VWVPWCAHTDDPNLTVQFTPGSLRESGSVLAEPCHPTMGSETSRLEGLIWRESPIVSRSIMSPNVNAERKNPLAGTWKLKSCEVRTTASEVTYPFGRDAKGYLIMTPDGYWSVALMSTNRLQFSSGDVLGGTTQEKVSAAEGYISYVGRYDIQGNKVAVRVEVSFFPNWVGRDQERFFEVRGNTLELSTSPLLMRGKQQTAHLVWERAS